MFETLNLFPEITVTFAVIFGLCIGSFLNVVIFRLPAMMEQEFRYDSIDYLSDEFPELAKEQREVSLSLWGASRCPKCRNKIKPHWNIPIISFLCLKGKSGCCNSKISGRYPSIELLTGVSSGVIAWCLPASIEMILYIVISWYLIALFMIDFDTMLLPDTLNTQLMFIVLISSASGYLVSLEQGIWGLLTAVFLLYSAYILVLLLFKKESLGLGDIKLMSVLGFITGPLLVPFSILVAAIISAVLLISKSAAGEDTSKPFPFGPSLILGSVVCFINKNYIESFFPFLA